MGRILTLIVVGILAVIAWRRWQRRSLLSGLVSLSAEDLAGLEARPALRGLLAQRVATLRRLQRAPANWLEQDGPRAVFQAIDGVLLELQDDDQTTAHALERALDTLESAASKGARDEGWAERTLETVRDAQAALGRRTRRSSES